MGTCKATCTKMTIAVTQPYKAEIAEVTGMPDVGTDVAELKLMSKK